jgi:thiol-disulfide isomerase/thioredoxin
LLHQETLSAASKPFILAAMTIAVACQHAPTPDGPGTAGPQVVGVERFREEMRELKGHPVVVNFWATWCDPCVEEFPELVAASREWRPKGVRFVSASADDAKDVAAVRQMLDRAGASFDSAVVLSGNMDDLINDVDPAWGGALPSTFVYASDGHLVEKRLGRTIDRQTLATWLVPLVSP